MHTPHTRMDLSCARWKKLCLSGNNVCCCWAFSCWQEIECGLCWLYIQIYSLHAFNYHQIASAQALGPLELYQFSWLHSNNIANICKIQGSSTKFWQQTCQKNTCPNVYLAKKGYFRALASSPGHSQILSCSHGEKLGEGCSCKIKSGSGLGTRLLEPSFWLLPQS